MKPTTNLQSMACLALRVLALGIFVVGLWQLVANLLLGWRDFDPSYASYFFQTLLLRPLVGMALALLLYLGSKPLSRWMTPGDGE